MYEVHHTTITYSLAIVNNWLWQIDIKAMLESSFLIILYHSIACHIIKFFIPSGNFQILTSSIFYQI